MKTIKLNLDFFSCCRLFLILGFNVFLYLAPNIALAGLSANEQEQDKHIILLLKSKNFDQLDKDLDQVVKIYNENFLQERQVDLAFDAFYRSDPEFELLLNEWIKTAPKSYAAYLARGIYYTRLGWDQRGTKYIDETTKQQLDGMDYYFQKAFRDLTYSETLNNRLLHPLCYKIEILMNYGNENEINKLYKKALKINSYSLTARWYYISTILPRWGGSTQQINNEIKAARPYYVKNPALKILDGRLAAELGDEAFFSGNYPQAIQFYNDALKFGNHWFYNAQRGDAYYYNKEFRLSKTDLETAISLRPNYQRPLLLLTYVEQQLTSNSTKLNK